MYFRIDQYDIILKCIILEVLCMRIYLRRVPHPRNSFRVRWLSSHHPPWATVDNHEAITRILITGDVLFASMSSVPLFGCVRYDHQLNAGCRESRLSSRPHVLMSSSVNHDSTTGQYISLLLSVVLPRVSSHIHYHSHKHSIET